MLELVRGVDNVLHREPVWFRHSSMVRVDVNKVQLYIQFMFICVYI